MNSLISASFFLLLIVVFCSSDATGKIQKRSFLSNIFGSLTNKNKTNEVKPTSSNTTAAENNGGKEPVVEKKENGPLGAIDQGNGGNKTANETTGTGERKKSLIGDILHHLSDDVKKLIGMAEKLVSEVNEKAKTWKAKLTEFANLTKEEKQTLLGLNLQMAEDKNALKLNKTEEDTSLFRASAISLPKQFDARQKWAGCSPVIGAIADQSSCGSCWAVSTASVFNDRLCIQMLKGGKRPDLKARYSAADLMSCSTLNKGCSGGVPKYAWDYITKSGIVTGSEWVDKAGCKPYPFPPKKFKNNQNEVATPTCKSACTNTLYSNNYAKDKKFATNPTGWSGSGLELRMQQEIMANGPINAGMVCYEDLMYYAGGIYQHITGGSLGGHAVRIIGWGEDKGTKYWLVANSWNTEWGEKGLFKIRRGSDESRIESLHIAFGTPKI